MVLATRLFSSVYPEQPKRRSAKEIALAPVITSRWAHVPFGIVFAGLVALCLWQAMGMIAWAFFIPSFLVIAAAGTPVEQALMDGDEKDERWAWPWMMFLGGAGAVPVGIFLAAFVTYLMNG